MPQHSEPLPHDTMDPKHFEVEIAFRQTARYRVQARDRKEAERVALERWHAGDAADGEERSCHSEGEHACGGQQCRGRRQGERDSGAGYGADAGTGHSPGEDAGQKHDSGLTQ